MMDHLPTAKNAIHNYSGAVLFQCQNEYDGGPFLEYPQRSGVLPVLSVGNTLPGSISSLQSQQIQSIAKQEIEPILQTWIFFGLIQEVLGGICRPSDFIAVSGQGGENRRVLTTASLVATLDLWVTQVQSKTISPLPYYDHIAKCLRLAFAVLSASPQSLDQTLRLSLASLGEILTFAVNKAFDMDVSRDNKCPLTWNRLINPMYWERLYLESGLCISQVEKILSTGHRSIQALHFIGSLRQSGSTLDHLPCDKQQCYAYQNNLNTYQTQHTKRDCSCEDLAVDQQKLFAILKMGSLPLLRLKGDHDIGTISIEVVPSDSASKYLALSHVWADGLGNPHRNALPRCQLSLLRTMIGEFNTTSGQPVDDLLFWCDTLCCPVEPEANRLALSQMRRTYLEARFVLVLDASLRPYNSEGLGYGELCSRIVLSGWMRRLWTLQEGHLATAGGDHRLWFRFKDTAISGHSLLKSASTGFLSSSFSQRGIAVFAIDGMFSLTKKDSNNSSFDIRSIEFVLQGRSVSVKTDEALIITTLLGLDLSAILDGAEEYRFHRLWTLIPSTAQGIPKSVVFRVGPRLKEAGFRWAPATLLNNSDRNMNLIFLETTPGEAGQGLPSPDGLVVRLPGFKIVMAPPRECLPPNPWGVIYPSRHNSQILRGDDGSWYILSRALPPEEDCSLSHKTLRALLRDQSDLLNSSLWVTYLRSFFDQNGIQRTNHGLILSLVKVERDVKYARSEMHVYIALQTRYAQDMLELAFQLVQQLSTGLPAQQCASFNQRDVNAKSPAWQSSVLALESEMRSIARSKEVQETLAESVIGSQEAATQLLDAHIASIYAGEYGRLEEQVPEHQQWCVD
ncbi:hypothetical protein N7G274_008202 [Stereocaulon virgatum]|uniref:Heterokaryon incompatibility domain-containing protein n=1 Tax=Stereocaulon virgatum TaxID=373712 RepID=A0ABR4A2B1_9LECA